MGSPKALLEFRGRPLIQYPLDTLRKFCSEIFIVTQTPDLYQNLGAQVIQDLHRGYGPMGGIHAGLKNASNPWSIVLACDMPLVREELLRGLLEKTLGRDNLLAVLPLAPSGGELQKQPLCAAYSKSAIPFFEERIARNRISLVEHLNPPQALVVPWLELDPADRDAVSFTNLNTPQDLSEGR